MKYDGLTNIWLNIKNLSRYPGNSEDFMAIDHLKCKNGYCFLSRSKTIKNIPIDLKSLGMGFIFQDEIKTLTHEEADKHIEKILRALNDKFKIELRK